MGLPHRHTVLGIWPTVETDNPTNLEMLATKVNLGECQHEWVIIHDVSMVDWLDKCLFKMMPIEHVYIG